jgi:predicted O-methyltransferase YrrM
MNPVPEGIERFATLVGPERDDVIEEMDAHAKATGFPTVGPAVGGWFRLLARAVGAERVFEFGSGFGYSAYWFAEAVGPGGTVVLCEYDADNCERAREYLRRGGYLERCVIEQGDAIETVREHDGPFDVVLLDNEKTRYREAFEAVQGKVAPGGLVVADNAIASGDSIEFAELTALVAGEDVDTGESTRAIADYLAAVRAADGFETALLPLGEGVAVSRRGG